ncbi:hypothetical protein [Oerskovia turbata]
MSTTNHGPANHDDDLRRALHDLVDDASLPPLDAHLDVVRGRTRRRRAAKKAAFGATTLCVAGALGVAAISLPQGVRPEPVAPAESPTVTPTEKPHPTPTFPTPTTSEALACQQPAPTPTGGELPAHLSVDTSGLIVQAPGPTTAPVTTTFDRGARLALADHARGAYVVAQDGVIVSAVVPPAETPGPLTPEPGSSISWELNVDPSASCGLDAPHADAPSLPPGDYELFALYQFQLDSWAPVQPDGAMGASAPGVVFDGWLVAEPVPLTITPRPDPVTVRDAFAEDTSVIFEALSGAVATGAPATIDLLVETTRLIDEGDGTRTLTVERNQDVAPRERAVSDDGWTMTLHGGARFWSGDSFSRLLGTYDVTVDTSGAVPAFTLQVVDGGTPGAAPPTKDPEMCRAFREGEGTSSVYTSFETDVYALADDLSPASASSVHQAARARWVEAPRFWWAVQMHEVIIRDSGEGGDFVNGACAEYWEQPGQ